MENHADILQQRIEVRALGGRREEAQERVGGEQHEEEEAHADEAEHARHAGDHLGGQAAGSVTIPRGQLKNLKASYTLTEPQLTAPLKKGQVVGTIDFQLNGKSIEQRPLIVMENVEEGGFFGRVWDFVMMKFHQWFGSWFS